MDWPKMTLQRTDSGYLVSDGFSTVALPREATLKADVAAALRDGLKPSAHEAAELLGACELSYRVVDDWDGPGQLAQLVITAPRAVYDRLKDGRAYGEVMSCVMMLCEGIGSETLELSPESGPA